MKRFFYLVLGVIWALAGCTSTSSVGRPLIPDQAINITADTAIKLSNIAYVAAVAAVVHLVYDPLAPNWEIEESRLADDTYRFSLKMKRFHTGGAGESIQVLRRRASQLVNENGFGNYLLLDYSEGIESQTLGARRIAEGTVKLVQRQQADSFLMD